MSEPPFDGNADSLKLLGTFPAENVFTISDKSLFALARDTLGFLRWCRIGRFAGTLTAREASNAHQR